MTPIRKREVEQLAMRILQQYHIKDNPGKHLDVIAQGEKINVYPYDNWDFEKCGKLLEIGGEYTIFYNSKHNSEIRAFTIAHELGHYFLKHLQNSEPEIICLNRDLERIDDSDDFKKEREVEANHFAACLLLPLNLLMPVFQEFMRFNNRIGKIYVDCQRCNFTDYKKCVNCIRMSFLVSETAIRFRLINLGLMVFNIQFKPKEDSGIMIADLLHQLQNSAQ